MLRSWIRGNDTVENDWLKRTELLLGRENISKLQKTSVTVVGLGGVGSYATESLVRAGIGTIQLVDYDIVSMSNINRQLLATHATVGLFKTEVMKTRMLQINPELKIKIYSEFLNETNRKEVLQNSDHILDAIDSIGPKMGLIKDLCEQEIPFISVLGAGNRLNPEFIKIMSIWQTSGCPFAKRLKKLLRKYDILKDFLVVFSEEKPLKISKNEHSLVGDNASDKINCSEKNCDATAEPDLLYLPKSLIGSISYMPAIMGMMAASTIIRNIVSNHCDDTNKQQL